MKVRTHCPQRGKTFLYHMIYVGQDNIRDFPEGATCCVKDAIVHYIACRTKFVAQCSTQLL